MEGDGGVRLTSVNSRTRTEIRASIEHFEGLDVRVPGPVEITDGQIGTEESHERRRGPHPPNGRHRDPGERDVACGRRVARRQVEGVAERGAVPVVSGWLEVGDDPATSALCIELDDSILLATTARVSHNGRGWSEWHLEGVACTVDSRDPLALTLRYHGVDQRGGDALAWWSGEGTIAAADDRRGGRGAAVADGWRPTTNGSGCSYCSPHPAAAAFR